VWTPTRAAKSHPKRPVPKVGKRVIVDKAEGQAHAEARRLLAAALERIPPS
jgi:hypothetical protein